MRALPGRGRSRPVLQPSQTTLPMRALLHLPVQASKAYACLPAGTSLPELTTWDLVDICVIPQIHSFWSI